VIDSTAAALRVLVTDGDSRAALAVTRSLGRRGHAVLVAEKRTPCLAQTSRYCAERLVYPDPILDDVGFVQWFADIVRDRSVDIVLPIAEITTALVTENRALLEPQVRVPFADACIIERAADKADMARTAARLGIPVPRTVLLERPEELVRHLAGLPFPVVVKSRRSRIRTSDGWVSTSVRYAADASALERDVARRYPGEFPLLLQERIVGAGIGVFACYDRGRLVALFSHRRLREKPPTGGVSVLSESTEVCPVARRYTESLLGELNWHGVAMVEFKRDRRDDVPKLLEINPRFWGSLQLAIDAGVDFPALLLEMPGDEERASLQSYRVGVRNRWFWGDVDSLLLRLFNGAVPPDDTGPWGRTRAVGRFLKLWEKGLRYENPRLSDLRPWFYETAQWFSRSTRRSTASGSGAAMKSRA
jgi:predicted ATP-grasp superfamily ATP-dependent carboligase